MTADQSVARQAAHENRANQALKLLEALSAKSAYIEFGDFVIGREEVEVVGGGGSDTMLVLDTYTPGGTSLISREAFGTLAKALAKATGDQQ